MGDLFVQYGYNSYLNIVEYKVGTSYPNNQTGFIVI